MVSFIIQDNYEIVRLRYRVFIPEVQILLNEKLTLPFYNVIEEQKNCTSIIYNGNCHSLTNENIRQFNQRQPLTTNLIDFYMCLQNIYDRRSSSAYNSAHNDDSGFVAAKLKLFLPSVLMINNGEMPPTSQRTLSDLYLKISIPIQSVDGFWTCLIIDMYDKEIYFYDPREFTENTVQIMNTLEVYANKIFDFSRFLGRALITVLPMKDFTRDIDSFSYCFEFKKRVWKMVAIPSRTSFTLAFIIWPLGSRRAASS